MEETAKLGIALAFQNPPNIKGVTLSAVWKTVSKQTLDVKESTAFFSNILEKEINVELFWR